MEVDINLKAYLDPGCDAEIKKALRSCSPKKIKKFLPYLNTYILSKGSLNRDAFSDVLRSQCKEAIESIADLEQRLNEYVFRKGCINRKAFHSVLRSRNKIAIEIITPYLDRSDQYYILNKDGSLNARAVRNILCSRCKAPIEKVLPHLDNYIMPSGIINPKRIRNVLNSQNAGAINKIVKERYLTEYVQSSDKPNECLNKLQVGKKIKRRIQKELSELMFTFGSVENHLESLDFLSDSKAVHEILDTQNVNIAMSSSSRIHRKNSLPQLTANEVEQTLDVDRFSNSILFSQNRTIPVLPITSIHENRFDGVSIFSFHPPNRSEQSEDEKQEKKFMSLPSC
jgi:hypothetical protein